MDTNLREKFDLIRLNAQPGYGAINDLMHAAYELGKSESEASVGDGWISVETEPQDGQEVNIWLGDGSVRIATFYIRGEYGNYYSDLHRGISYRYPIKWQPLPQPPQK